MNTASTSMVRGDPAAILDRHAVRRAAGIPTLSLLVGPIGAGGRIWRRWAATKGRPVVVTHRNGFPTTEWIHAAAERIDLPTAVICWLAQRADRDPSELLAEWKAKTPADRARFWNTVLPDVDDDLLRVVANAAVGGGPSNVAAVLSDLGEQIVPALIRLAPSASWPSVLIILGSADDFLSAASESVQWAIRVSGIHIAIAVPAEVWDVYLATAAESRNKALLREGELIVPVIDATTVERVLMEVGLVGSTSQALVAAGADSALLDSAVAAIQSSASPPDDQAADDRARSAAERFLFEFLESLPETAGLFELNALLDFGFGPRPAEVDLLCHSPRIAIELDGYFHFISPDGYRRDRTKDWELQRRGFIVLRFLADDVIPQLELIRDRILDALALTPSE
jgi:hypothetical protein